MDEFEKIRAFSEELSRKTEDSLARENSVENVSLSNSMDENNTTEEGAEFLREWNTNSPETITPRKNLSKTFWIILSLAGVVLVGLLGVIFCLLHGPMENQEIITIPPTPTPVKVKPENPGGMVIPDQDKVIYSRLLQDTLPAKVEKLFPEEEPVLPPVEKVEPVVAEVVSEPEVDPVVVMAPEPVVEKIPKSKPVPSIKNTPVKAVQDKKTSEIWRVQLFSSSNKETVEKTWQTILKKHKGLVSDMPMVISKAEISGKGKFYRLQVGEFSSKERANTLCSKLKKQKQDCIAVSGK